MLCKLLGTCAFPRADENFSPIYIVGLSRLKRERKVCIIPTAMLHMRLTPVFASRFRFLPIVQPPASVFHSSFPHQLIPSACQTDHASSSISQLPKPVGLGLHFSVSQSTSRNLVIAIPHIFSSALFFYLSGNLNSLAYGCRLSPD